MDETLRFLHKVFSTKEPAYVHELLAPMQKLNDTQAHGTPSLLEQNNLRTPFSRVLSTIGIYICNSSNSIISRKSLLTYLYRKLTTLMTLLEFCYSTYKVKFHSLAGTQT